MTTADYLESLQDDLATIKTNLSEGGMSIDDGDDFSSIATKTVGIQIGGGEIPIYYIASNRTNVSHLPDNGYFINYSGIGDDQTTELTTILNDFASTGAPMMQLVVYTTSESGTGYTTNAVIYNSFGKLRETSANLCIIGEVFNTDGAYKTLHRVNIYYTYSNGAYTCTGTNTNTIKVQLPKNTDVLTKTNTTSYTPTSDYHPCTKLYADTVSSPVITTSSTSTYTIASLTGNNVYKLGEITALEVTAVTTFDKESVIYFESGTTATEVSLPSSITNLGDAPTMTETSGVNSGTCTASKNYIIAIQNNIAVWKEY